MKKVTAFVGSARKRATYSAAREFLDGLKRLGDVEGEIVPLGDYHLETCRGCKQCFEKGEEFCPFRDDDRNLLIAKIMASDGVVLATPNYSFNVSGLMKVFLDRLGFLFHRPRFFGKAFTGIVAQGIYGGDKIVDYLDFVGNGLGFNTVKGACFTAFEPMTDKEKGKVKAAMADLSRRFYKALIKPAYPTPGWMKLMVFRMGRTSIQAELDERSMDYRYYRDQGWFHSDYFYPARLGLLKRWGGSLFDALALNLAKKRAG